MYFAKQALQKEREYLKALAEVQEGKRLIRPDPEYQPQAGPSHLPYDTTDYAHNDCDDQNQDNYQGSDTHHPTLSKPRRSRKRNDPERVKAAFASWSALLPTLEDDFLEYIAETGGGQQGLPVHQTSAPCDCADQARKQKSILCYLWDREWSSIIESYQALTFIQGLSIGAIVLALARVFLLAW